MKNMFSIHCLAAVVLLALPVAAFADLQPVQVNDSVQYVTGGVGLDESTAIKAMRPDYPLTMVFAETTTYGRNQYLYGVQVEVHQGNNLIFNTRTLGPYLLVMIPPGSYRVTATHNGVPKTQTIKVGTKPKQVAWTWPAPIDEDDPYQ